MITRKTEKKRMEMLPQKRGGTTLTEKANKENKKK